ncbi:MAG: DUF1841 family protein [Burkholderiaceae bacterium]|nr:MAG: DUF1841 family protein [Burkholderiaceae bacterium]
MFNPSRAQVRQFFCDTWRKHQSKTLISPQESIALRWMLEHPEYQSDLEDPDAQERDFSPEAGRTNPFLHLSMHLAIEEQLAIDQPPGIRTLYEQLRAHCETPHHAAHIVMECLGAVLWQAQRDGTAPDNEAYLECLRRQLK